MLGAQGVIALTFALAYGGILGAARVTVAVITPVRSSVVGAPVQHVGVALLIFNKEKEHVGQNGFVPEIVGTSAPPPIHGGPSRLRAALGTLSGLRLSN